MATISSDVHPAVTSGDHHPAYARYVLGVLFLANCFNSMDRSIMTSLVEPIRKDLRLNDTQIGLIGGLGYAVVYTLTGILIARLVDRGNRKNTLAAGIAFWSTMTALTGQAAGFWTMLVTRFGIAGGEAACYPNALSLIGDYFERSKRPRAIALFHLGTYGGIILGVTSAGLVASHFGWRAAFYLLGLPGLALAALVFLTVREPLRGMSDGPGTAAATSIPYGGIRVMAALLASNRTFALLVASSVCIAVAQVTMGSWVPAFLMRTHGVSQADVGVLAGPVIGLSGVFGTVLGGFWGTRIAQRDPRERAPLMVLLISAPLAVPALLLFLFAPTLPLTLLGGALTVFFISMHFGPLVAVTIGSVGIENRGAASSLLVVAQFLIGFGLGPLVVGALSDWLEPVLGQNSLRYAMIVAPLMTTIGLLLGALASRRMGDRVAARHGHEA